eukprot:jgi/Tetstr1/460889/TSEL_006046.t1
MSGSGSSTDPEMVGGVDSTPARRRLSRASRRRPLLKSAYRGGSTERRPRLFPIPLDSVLEYMIGNSRLQPVADEYAACCGTFIAGMAIELRKLRRAAPTGLAGVRTAARGRRLQHGGRRRRSSIPVSCLRKRYQDTQMHNGDTFALDVERERYLRAGTENMRSLEITELLGLYKDHVYDANIASVEKSRGTRAVF